MKENGTMKSRIALMGAMCIFGTVGILRRYIDLPSSVIALVRGAVGVVFLLCLTAIMGKKTDRAAIRKNLGILLLSGAFIGFNWILLFEAYCYTSVATATLSYYMAPILVVLASPIVLKERLTGKKLACVGVALVGMVLVSGVVQTGFSGLSELKGVALGLGAAVLYASVVLLNKKLGEISAYDKTIVQLAAAAVVLLPYTLLTEDMSALHVDTLGLVLLLVAGVVHTGAAYALYFGSMKDLPAQTVALYSYIDPILAVVLSAVFLREPMTIGGMVGAVMILGAAFFSER